MLRNLLTLPRRRLVFKIAGLSVFLVAIAIAFFTYNAYRRERWLLQERSGFALERIVATAALGIDGDAHRRALQGEPGEQKEENTERARIRDYLRRVQVANELEPAHIVTYEAPTEAQPTTLKYGITLGGAAPGTVYEVPETTQKALAKALEGLEGRHTKLYEDEGGSYVSAYAPILDRDGKLAGVLEADSSLDRFHVAMHERLVSLLLTSLSGIVLAIVLSGFLAYGIGRALQSIRAGADAIRDSDYDHRVTVNRRDELGLVATQFNAMVDTLRERFLMLKFIPKHTLDAIVRHSREQAGREIEAAQGSVVFTDIRGYTQLAEGLPPERIVKMLNMYVRRQAEILGDHGGVIDKFIGDALLGVFMGEEHVRRAVAAGLAIQEAMIQMNTDGVFELPIRVGVGIATGNLVLAEIGSDARRERTLIGSVVNLAARLCSGAQADEVLVSEAVRAALGDALSTRASRALALKGFADVQTCHVAERLAA